MLHYRLTLFAVLIFALTLIPVFSYADETPVEEITGTSQINNMTNIPGHDMSSHNHNMDMPASAGSDMTSSNMTGTGLDADANHESGQNSQTNDTTSHEHDTSTGDIPDQNMNGMNHDMTADMPAHNMDMPEHGDGTVQESNNHQSEHGEINPKGKEVNRANLLGGFGLVNGLIILGAVFFKRKSKMGGAV